jgi:hypothetical protein
MDGIAWALSMATQGAPSRSRENTGSFYDLDYHTERLGKYAKLSI